MTDGYVSAWANSFAAIGAILTAFLAYHVYIEAKKIRQLEWVEKSCSMWNEFNALVAQAGNQEIWAGFLKGRDAKSEVYDYENQVNPIIFSFLNVLITSSHAVQISGGSQEYFLASLTDQFARLFPRRIYLFALLQECGYDDDFTSRFKKFCNAVDSRVARGVPVETALAEVKAYNWWMDETYLKQRPWWRPDRSRHAKALG